MNMKTIEVVAAVIQNNNQILCVQRGPSKYDYVSRKYEFPGGKVEAGETKEQAIIREVKEELHIDIINPQFYLTVEHTYPDFAIVMHSFLCVTETQQLTLTEHIDAKWLKNSELEFLDWAEADVPIVKKLIHK
jgi:8-oxo-dGTP diphosphatase